MLIPRLSAKTRSGQPFTWRQYKKNREYQAALGFAVGVAWLLFKLVS